MEILKQKKTKITPEGITRAFLQKQIDGLTGHIENAGHPFDKTWWGNNDANDFKCPEFKWVEYEQTAYWLDGYLRCAILLNDKAAINRAAEIIYSVINTQDGDGYLGPACLKKADGWNRWPHTVFFRACIALYETNGDAKIPEALTAHYLGKTAVHDKNRDVTNIEIMLWLYSVNGNEKLLKTAEENYLSYNEKCTNDNRDAVALSDKKPYAHGVTYNEYSKLGAILYKYTGKKEYLTSSEAAYKKLDEMFMLPGGCHCSDEFLISNDCMECYETCDITDFTWSLKYLFDATKNGKYADRIEKCVFNAGMGSVLEDFKALQYFSCANQVIADKTCAHTFFFKGSSWMSYRPNPGTECCPGNVNRFFPNYVNNLWNADGDKIYAVMYGASVFEVDGITIKEITDYPFEEAAKFKIKTEKPFDFYIRIPEWAESFKIDCGSDVKTAENGFVFIRVNTDCNVTVKFTSAIKRHKTANGIYFSKGPLVYSLGQIGRREIDADDARSTPSFPAYNIYANKKWNYGVNENTPAVFCNGTACSFDLKENLPSIKITAYDAPEWTYDEVGEIEACDNLYEMRTHKETGKFVFTPSPDKAGKISDEATEITLKPYGACKLRITVFPIKEE